jgi:hypothetical protein
VAAGTECIVGLRLGFAHRTKAPVKREDEMSTKVESLRLPVAKSGRWHWLVVLLALMIALGFAVTLSVVRSLSSTDTDTTISGRLAPSGQHAHHRGVAVTAPATNVLQVGGTSVFRYHPLPGVNTVFELAPAAAAGAAGGDHLTVGGSSDYQHHQLP